MDDNQGRHSEATWSQIRDRNEVTEMAKISSRPATWYRSIARNIVKGRAKVRSR